MKVPQTLHGYDQGHRLLAAGGDISSAEHDLLERLSDLSGYLPIGTRFDRYFTGFPCGRYYAVSCTWPDADAPRGGAVLTHSLLLPQAEAGSLGDLGAALRALRRPLSARFKADYAALQFVDLASTRAVPAPRHAKDALTLLFGEAARPIVWIDAIPCEDIVTWLWSLLWPEARLDFSFCTFTLAPRQVAGRVFTFLGVPPAASGAFSNLGAHPAWWEEGRMRPVSAAPTFVAALARNPQAEVIRLLAIARSAGLQPKAPELGLLHRLDELRDGAGQRLTAARSYADLLAARFPALPPTHPWWSEALLRLLERQPDAPMEPRPLWDLIDLLKRPQALALAAEPLWSNRMEVVLRDELVRRLTAQPALASESLGELFAALQMGWDLWPPVLAAIEEAVARAPEPAHRLLVAQAVIRAQPMPGGPQGGALIAAALRPLNPATRTEVLATAPLSGEQQRRAEDVARALQDLHMLFAAVRARAGEPEALRVSARFAVESGREGELSALCDALEPSVVLEWVLEEPRTLPASLASAFGGQAARRMKLPAEAIAARWPARPGVPRTLLGLGCDRWEMERALRGRADLAANMVVQALEQDSRGSNLAAEAALAAAVPLELLTPTVRTALGRGELDSLRRSVLRALAPELARALLQATLVAEDAASWLSLGPIRNELSQMSPYALATAAPNALPILAEAIDVAAAPPSLEWAHGLIAAAMQSANPEALNRSVSPLLRILDRPPESRDRAFLSLEILAAIRRTRAPDGHPLVVRTFREVYPTIVEGGRLDWWKPWTWFADRGWDRAKSMRHWLVDTWIENRWPPIDLIRTMDGMRGEEALFGKVAKRALKSPGGRALLQQAMTDLPPTLRAKWRGPLEHALDQPPNNADDD